MKANRKIPKGLVHLSDHDDHKPVDIDDTQVWKSFKKGDESAFIFIYETYFHQLYQYGQQFIQDSETVKDLIQDLFIEIRNSRKRLSDTDSIKFYLYKCIKRKINKKSKKNRFSSLMNDHPFWFSHSIEHTIIQNQLNAEKIEALNKGVASLTQRQREAIYYYFYEDLSYEQIKELMDFSSTRATRNLIYRAIKDLRSGLDIFNK